MRKSWLLTLAVMAGCSSPADPGPSGTFAAIPNWDEPFSLKIGEQAYLEPADVHVRFVAVPTDSRCPSNALILCVWVGDAAVTLEVDPVGGDAVLETLHTTLDPRSLDVGGGTLQLQRLDPYPEDVSPIPEDAYVVTLVFASPR